MDISELAIGLTVGYILRDYIFYGLCFGAGAIVEKHYPNVVSSTVSNINAAIGDPINIVTTYIKNITMRPEEFHHRNDE